MKISPSFELPLDFFSALDQYLRVSHERHGLETQVSRPQDLQTRSFSPEVETQLLRIRGKDLKFTPANADEGVFINDGAAETRLSIYSVVSNKRIDALIPPGTSGALTITVRARYTEGGELRQSAYHRQVTAV